MATTDSVKHHKTRKLIAYLSEKEGRGMEFISLYIPREMSIDEIITILKKKSDSLEIKSEKSRDRVRDSLRNVEQRLKLQKEIPENGLAIFAGTFATSDPESEVLNIEQIIPPEPIIAYLCEIDDHFHLEPLREMLREERVVGLLAMDSKEAGFGILDGERLDMIEDITSGIPGKSEKGGWSQKEVRERTRHGTHILFPQGRGTCNKSLPREPQNYGVDSWRTGTNERGFREGRFPSL